MTDLKNYILVNHKIFYEVIGSKNIELSVEFIENDDIVHSYTKYMLPPTYDIIGVEEYSFKQLDYPPLFQISLPNGYIPIFYFVTDEFIDIVNRNNIKGFKFEKIWDSEKD